MVRTHPSYSLLGSIPDRLRKPKGRWHSNSGGCTIHSSLPCIPRLRAHQAGRPEKAPLRLLLAQALGSSPVEVMALPFLPAAKFAVLLWLGAEASLTLNAPNKDKRTKDTSKTVHFTLLAYIRYTWLKRFTFRSLPLSQKGYRKHICTSLPEGNYTSAGNPFK